jgi:hypothetical protein
VADALGLPAGGQVAIEVRAAKKGKFEIIISAVEK